MLEIAYVPATAQQAARDLLFQGVTVRLAPVGRWMLMETAPSEITGRRGRRDAALLRLEGLARIAESAFGVTNWPVLIAGCDRRGFGRGARSLTLVLEGRTVVRHRWAGPGSMPSLGTAREHAGLLTEAVRAGDPREIARLLRDPGDPAILLARTLTALQLPWLPDGFGQREEILADDPGARVHRARSLWQGLRNYLNDDTDPDADPEPDDH